MVGRTIPTATTRWEVALLIDCCLLWAAAFGPRGDEEVHLQAPESSPPQEARVTQSEAPEDFSGQPAPQDSSVQPAPHNYSAQQVPTETTPTETAPTEPAPTEAVDTSAQPAPEDSAVQPIPPPPRPTPTDAVPEPPPH